MNPATRMQRSQAGASPWPDATMKQPDRTPISAASLVFMTETSPEIGCAIANQRMKQDLGCGQVTGSGLSQGRVLRGHTRQTGHGTFLAGSNRCA